MSKITLSLLLIVALTVGTCVYAFAFSRHLMRFNSNYETSGTPLDNCLTCHKKNPPKPPKRNPYGKAYKSAGYVFEAIEEQDSDGDGFTNLTEITGGTFPGNRRSKPAVQ